MFPQIMNWEQLLYLLNLFRRSFKRVLQWLIHCPHIMFNTDICLKCFDIAVYLLKGRAVEPEKQPLLGNVRTQ
jgi:hypothetical protein